jgi:hypothetical protein
MFSAKDPRLLHSAWIRERAVALLLSRIHAENKLPQIFADGRPETRPASVP